MHWNWCNSKWFCHTPEEIPHIILLDSPIVPAMGHDVERVEVVPLDAADSAIGDIGAEGEKMPPLCIETSVAVGAAPAVMVEARVGAMRVDESPSTQNAGDRACRAVRAGC